MRTIIIGFLSCFIFLGELPAQQDRDRSGIEDDKTKDPRQNAAWKRGDAAFPAKPKDMWELGIHTGHYLISGDIPLIFPAGYGLGLHVRKSLGHTFSLRGEIFYGNTKGLEFRKSSAQAVNRDLVDTRVHPSGFFRNYKNQTYYLSVSGAVSLGNILFHDDDPTWNLTAFIGLGLNHYDVKVDALDENGNKYDVSGIPDGNNADTRQSKKEIRDQLRELYDGTYETDAKVQEGMFTIGDNEIGGHVQFGMAISYKINRRFNLSLEHHYYLQKNDWVDGFRYRTDLDQSIEFDAPQYTCFRLGMNLGDFSNRIEPLYWVNPLNPILQDIADMKERPKIAIKDSDQDGVIDMLDEEPNTPEGAKVDQHGVTMDSDDDGIPDHEDEEPYSPPGYEVNDQGVAKTPFVTEDQINQLITNKVSSINTNWYLPMIHFDLNKFYIREKYYPQLHHVAQVMKMHPNLKIVVEGHADNRKDKKYNESLSYNRSAAAVNYLMDEYDFPRERFIIQYRGESNPLVENLPDDHDTSFRQEYSQFMNRRVEFRVANTYDEEMPPPDDAKAGEKTPGSSRDGVKYSGNRAGY